uniref:Uncharacterized protein n=1 Tax=Talaromyces marneffei PM1 TaxID=1077442 RepID=A0A093VK34_TALMA
MARGHWTPSPTTVPPPERKFRQYFFP